MAAGQEDFYFNVKVPLILETIESFTSQTQENALLHYLMELPQHQDVNISRLMQDLLGENEAMVRAYFSGTSFIPNYWNLSAQNWSRSTRSICWPAMRITSLLYSISSMSSILTIQSF